jgi:hypothetical protein
MQDSTTTTTTSLHPHRYHHQALPPPTHPPPVPPSRLSKPSRLVPAHISNKDPSYLVAGGLVFTVCTEPYLQSEYGGNYLNEAPVKLLDKLYAGQPQQAGEEVVVLSQVFASDVTLGYEDKYNVQVCGAVCACVCGGGLLCTCVVIMVCVCGGGGAEGHAGRWATCVCVWGGGG